MRTRVRKADTDDLAIREITDRLAGTVIRKYENAEITLARWQDMTEPTGRLVSTLMLYCLPTPKVVLLPLGLRGYHDVDVQHDHLISVSGKPIRIGKTTLAGRFIMSLRLALVISNTLNDWEMDGRSLETWIAMEPKILEGLRVDLVKRQVLRGGRMVWVTEVERVR